ncbi:hypothetical protein [Nocardia cyriacigeorgica]|uniref:hypothetical protein n=1 Tax=Nocardia cyriacigeorgica TaxID=135487 RepID=UPI001895D0A7|nr:hypothetical protein [Nocardia cyriacigeorgica]MBF6457372.1 hypothetical protein [Nocardia cyriacigeorgica]MBF6482223.1 hypothetical protein [Nocardia cyriacigeorgica]MBF6553017.1 hypothetical protein [Nocardia cyriacigeorgica]
MEFAEQDHVHPAAGIGALDLAIGVGDDLRSYDLLRRSRIGTVQCLLPSYGFVTNPPRFQANSVTSASHPIDEP